MTKLISGRVHKVPSANVSAERYQFLELSEAEPDLGLPSELGQVFTSDLDGNRYWSRLDTANVIETANLYFTNTRAIAALTNVDISFNNVIVYGDLTLLGSADIEGNPTLSDISGINSIGAQEVFADEVTSNIWHNLYTSNVIELDNLYFTNTRAVAALTNVDISFNNVIVYGDLTLLGSADIEGNPTLSDISGINSIGAQEVFADEVTSNIWHNLYTANVIESSNNLYYTNDRVFSFVTGMSIGDLVDVANIYTYPISNALVGIQLGQALVWDGNIFIPTFVNSEVANVADLAVRVLSLEGQTTANVEEAASNLYFTNTRVLNAISLADISPNNVNANNIIVDSITANVWNRLYTANVIETAGNLYFTSQRARDSVSNSTGVYYNTTTGVFSIGQDVALTSDVQFRDLTLSGNLFILGNVAYIAANTLQINDPLIQIGIGNPGDQWDLGLVGHYLDGGQRHTGLFRDATDGKFKFFSNTTVEPGNVNYIDITEDSFRLASVVAESFEGNVIGTVSSIANHNTDALTEGSNNLYFTNVRAVAALTNVDISFNNVIIHGDLTLLGSADIEGNPTLSDISGINSIGAQEIFADEITSNIWHNIYTSNVVELNNLYFTNARVFSALTNADISFNNVIVYGDLTLLGSADIEGNPTLSDISGINSIGAQEVFADEITSNIWYNIYTSNVIEFNNLYFTNARVLSNVEQMSINVLADVDITGVSVNATLVWDGTKFIPGSTDIALRSNFANTATFANVSGVSNVALLTDRANVVSSLSNHNTSNLAEGTNLYFSNARARNAFTGGRGIIIQEDGVIKSTIGSYLFNTEVNGTQSYVVTNSMSAALTLNSSPVNDRYIIRSMHVTNISNSPAYISANVLYATGNTASLANLIPVPVGGILEFMDKPQILQPNDKINIQGFNSSGIPTSNLLHTTFSVEQISSDIAYFGTGITLPTSNTNTLLVNAEQSYAVIESIKFVNLKTYSVPVKLLITDANSIVKSYLAYNTQVPPNSSLEILQTPKNLAVTDKLYASYSNASNADAISVFTSYRYSSITDIAYTQTSGTPGQTVSVNFSTTIQDGTTLYYTLE